MPIKNNFLIKIKRILLGRKPKKYNLPYEFALINWTNQAKENGFGGAFAKKIDLYRHMQHIRTLPYSVKMLFSLYNNKQMPFYDVTGGKDHPDSEVFDIYNPAEIKSPF